MADHHTSSTRTTELRAAFRSLLGLGILLGTVTCGPGPIVDGAIDREVFIQTYVDLRMAALDTDSQRVADPARDSILGQHRVTAEELLYFAEAYADETDFMRDVWGEIEARMDRSPGEVN